MTAFDLPAKIGDKKPRSQPKYTPELLSSVLMQIAEGRTVTQAAANHGLSRRIISMWSLQDDKIRAAYLAAKQMGYAALGDECLEIADDLEDDPASRKVRVWTRLQLLARWNPKDWAPRVEVRQEINIASAVGEARSRVIEHRSAD